MKRLRFIVIGFAISVFFASAAVAQEPVPSKVALVNTSAFYFKDTGINKIAAAYAALDLEFKADFEQLDQMSKRFGSLQNEAQALQKSTVPVKPETLQAKVDEAEKLQRDFKFKQEDAKARYEKREEAVLGPIVMEIGKSIGAYAKQKGFTLVLDSGKLFETRILLFLQDTTEITSDFIKNYNASPAGSASSTPK